MPNAHPDFHRAVREPQRRITRMVVLAAALFLTTLLVAIPLGLFGEALQAGFGATGQLVVESTLFALATLVVCVAYARRWPEGAVSRTVLAYVVMQVLGFGLAFVLLLLLPDDDTPLPMSLILLDVVLGLIFAVVGAALGARWRSKKDGLR